MDGLYLKITQDFAPDPKEARFGGKDAPMAVEKGDIIFDVRKRGDGWMYGKNLNSGKTGKFPESCAAKLTGSKSGSGSDGPDSDKKDEKPVVKKEGSKPAWLQNRTTSSTPTVKKTSAYPKPFAGNIRQPQEKKEEKRETSGDSGVVEDSTEGNYCNADDDSKPANRDALKTGNTVKDDKQKELRSVPRSLASNIQTVNKQNPEPGKASTPQKEEKEPVKTIGKPFRLNLNKSGEASKPTSSEPKAVPRAESKITRNFPRSAPTPQKASQEDLDENYEPVEKKSEEKGPLLPKEAPKSSQKKDEPKTADVKAVKINPIDKPKKASEKNQSNVTTVNAAGGAGVNIQENPLSKDEGTIYQVPGVVGPPKPARNFASGCSECNETHIYDTPMHYKTPPGSPSTDKRDGHKMKSIEKTKEKKGSSSSTSLKPTSSVIRKTKEQIKHRMASYEDIIEMEGKGSDDSLADAELSAKETKEKLLTPKKRPKMRILLGTLLGLLLGVFLFLTLYLLARLHVVACIVSALIIGFVVATVFAFLDKTRVQCIVLLVFPSLFATGGKISLWLIITFFIISGPMCNFIENVRIVAVSRGCLMNSDSLADNGSVNPAGFVVVNENNRGLVQQVQKYENISHELLSYINYSLLLSSSERYDNLTGDNSSSGVICVSFLYRAHNICSSEINDMYNECKQTLASAGIRGDLQAKCEFISPKNACNHLSKARTRNTCQNINTANANTLFSIKKILERSPERIRTKELLQDDDPAALTTGKLCEFVTILAMLLPLLLLLVLYEAYRYHKLYLSCNEFDNHYLTLRFKAIEDMRKSSGAADLLVPLKKAELKKFVQPTACQLAEPEKRSLLKYLLIYVIYLLFALMIIPLDHFFYVVISNEEPQSNILKKCNGNLKRPQEMYTIIISTLLGVLLLLILLQPFVLRLRRLISSRFYHRRERKRIAYLYYRLLEERKTFYKSVIENMNNFNEETVMLNSLDAVLVLCNHFSWIKTVLEFVGVNIRRCAVCGSGLNKKYLVCDTEDCGVIYCRTCFWDLENKCLGCMSNSKMTSRSSSLSGQSQRKKNDYVKPV